MSKKYNTDGLLMVGGNEKPESAGGSEAVNKHDFTMLETVLLLKQTTPMSSVTVIILSFIIIYITYPYLPSFVLPVWLVCLVLTFVLRFYFSTVFEDAYKFSVIPLESWLKRFQFSTMLTGWVWAIGETVILFTANGLAYEHYVFMTFVVTGFFVGAMLALSVDKRTMIMSCIPSLVPMFWAFHEMAGKTAVASGIAFSLFLVYIYFTALRHGNSLHENLTLRHSAVEDEKRLKEILNDSPIAACITAEGNDKKLFVNERYEEIIAPFSNAASTIKSLMTEDENNALIEELKLKGKVSNKLIALKGLASRKERKWVLASFSLFNYHQKPAILSWYYDITERKKMEDEIHHLAYHDSLTRLPNRALFHDRMKTSILQANRDNTKVGLMYIDLDGFKQINDSFDHALGDGLLKEAANRMAGLLRDSDTVARLGGDEFAVIIEINEADDAAVAGEKVRQSIEKEFVIGNTSLKISCSIGIAIYPDHGNTVDALLKRADNTMYDVKKAGRNKVILSS